MFAVPNFNPTMPNYYKKLLAAYDCPDNSLGIFPEIVFGAIFVDMELKVIKTKAYDF